MKLLFLFGVLAGLVQLAGSRGKLPDMMRLPAVQTLQEVAPVAFAVDPNRVKSNALYRQLLTDEVGSLTPANVMKLSRISPQRGGTILPMPIT